MSLTFNDIDTFYYDADDKLFVRKSITIQPGITILVGCNGSGKSTLLRHINHSLEKEDNENILHGNGSKTYIISYDEEHDGRSMSKDKYGLQSDLVNLSRALLSSEGENIVNNIGNFVIRSLAFFKAYREGKVEYNGSLSVKKRLDSAEKVVVLLDGIDSGLSLDVIEEINGLFKMIVKDYQETLPNIPLYIIVTSNTYEMTKGNACINCRSMATIKFPTYESYHMFIIRSRKAKDRRLQTAACHQRKREEKDTIRGWAPDRFKH